MRGQFVYAGLAVIAHDLGNLSLAMRAQPRVVIGVIGGIDLHMNSVEPSHEAIVMLGPLEVAMNGNRAVQKLIDHATPRSNAEDMPDAAKDGPRNTGRPSTNVATTKGRPY